MIAVELFAGIGGFRIAADRLGIKTVWANDVCPLACRVYRDRFEDGVNREGDVGKLLDVIPQHDLLTGGFPCQPFSSAGKKEGIDDSRGTLFQHIVEVLRRCRPQYFVLENVKRLLTMERGRHFATILDALAELDYWIEWRLLNASHFGLPQNRQRVFILGVRHDLNQDAVEYKVPNIRLATFDDIASSCDFDSGVLCEPFLWRKISKHGIKFPNWGIARRGRFYSADLTEFSERVPSVQLGSIIQPESEVDIQFDFTESTIRRITKSEPVNRFVEGVEILSNQGGGARMGYTVFGTNGLAPTLTATPSRHYERYKIADRYRRLTNIEYARLQGFPDDHCRVGSVYSQYALFGNAVPPPMAEWCLGRVFDPGTSADEFEPRLRQRTLFADA